MSASPPPRLPKVRSWPSSVEEGRRTTPEPAPTVETQANAAALTLSSAVLGRAPTDVETTALQEIFQATAQALKRGFNCVPVSILGQGSVGGKGRTSSTAI